MSRYVSRLNIAETHLRDDAGGFWCRVCRIPWQVRVVQGAPEGGCLVPHCPECGGDYVLAATTVKPSKVRPTTRLRKRWSVRP